MERPARVGLWVLRSHHMRRKSTARALCRRCVDVLIRVSLAAWKS